MKVSLVDVDGHNFPNFALMKLSAWHMVWFAARNNGIYEEFKHNEAKVLKEAE